jgi:diguanylate cyclase (GGDEF)-like protein
MPIRRRDDDITGSVPAIGEVGLSEPRRGYLIVLTGGQMGQLFAIENDQLVIGRGAQCEVRIQDDGVSRRQAHLLREEGALSIEDLGSRNGTWVNGKKLSGRQSLVEGDKIQVGTGTVVKYVLIDRFEAAYQKRMFEAAVKDALTSAFNRRHFHERIETELAFARRHNTPLAMLMIDIDHFKRVNDEHGHVVGDKFLQALVRRLRATVRAEDLLARYGGEEFAILTRIDGPGARAFAERIRADVAEKRFVAHGVEMPVTVSIGVAVFPEVPADTPKKLVEAADQALYRAKKAGRNRVDGGKK